MKLFEVVFFVSLIAVTGFGLYARRKFCDYVREEKEKGNDISVQESEDLSMGFAQLLVDIDPSSDVLSPEDARVRTKRLFLFTRVLEGLRAKSAKRCLKEDYVDENVAQ
jgi:hypothetical protein